MHWSRASWRLLTGDLREETDMYLMLEPWASWPGQSLTSLVNLTTGPLVCPCYTEIQGWFRATSQGSQWWKEGGSHLRLNGRVETGLSMGSKEATE